MARKKILNDPVYGFISLPYGIIFDLIEHPYVQRLRRIKQVGLTHYVYPGALHTRFHHALGALHLMQQAIETLRSKEVEISEEEATAVYIAILLHDIGHGPFSHTLENSLIRVSHERISELFMEYLNDEFDGQLTMAIQIFKDQYPKHFLHQLVSSQLDMDRLDYLNRDSFFTGVYEGVIGYDRIIKMLAVHNDELVVEQKGLYSVEKFLIARRLMYWQVYLHKTVMSAEQMLLRALSRARDLVQGQVSIYVPENLYFFISNHFSEEDFVKDRDRLLQHFAALDDHDVVFALKQWVNASDPVLSFLSASLINRKLFQLEWSNEPFSESILTEKRRALKAWWKGNPEDIAYLFLQGSEVNRAYNSDKDEIKILFKDGTVEPMSKNSEYDIQSKLVRKYYLCYPKQAF